MPSDAYIAISLVPGIGFVRLRALLSRFGRAERIFEAKRDALLGVPGISHAAATAIAAASPRAGAKTRAEAHALGAIVLGPDDPDFPPILKTIPSPPPLLFAVGDIGLARRDAVAIVGSRDHSRYGSETAAQLAGGAAGAGLVVVSGMARGIDAVAHRGALEVGGATIGVLGNGHGVVYPAANRGLYRDVAEHGLLLSEFPPGERPNAGSFPRRNRLISGLARVTVVVEAGIGSGALITADAALAQGRDVMAVPGPVTSPVSAGTNRLIQAGATPLLELRDLLEAFGPQDADPGDRSVATLSGEERAVMGFLEAGFTQIDEIVSQYPGDAAELSAVLTSLEIRGIVTQHPGKIFRPSASASMGGAITG